MSNWLYHTVKSTVRRILFSEHRTAVSEAQRKWKLTRHLFYHATWYSAVIGMYVDVISLFIKCTKELLRYWPYMPYKGRNFNPNLFYHATWYSAVIGMYVDVISLFIKCTKELLRYWPYMPYKGRNFNPRILGKYFYFVICMNSRHWFQTNLLSSIA